MITNDEASSAMLAITIPIIAVIVIIAIAYTIYKYVIGEINGSS
jgi:hypothetical protein